MLALVLAVITATPLWASDDNALAINNLTLPVGTTQAILTVDLNNVAEISDLQFDLYLPTGFSVAYDEDDFPLISIAGRTTDRKHSIDYLERTDGSMRVMCTSSKGYTFSGNSGAVLTITLNVANMVAAGTYNVELKQIRVSNSENTYAPANTTSTITVEGETNPPSPPAAYSLAIPAVTIDTDNTNATLTVELNNETAISDMQFDLYLPAGFSVAYDEENYPLIRIVDRTTEKRHSIDYLERADGSMRVMCTSSKGYTFSGNSGAVLEMILNVANTVTPGAYNVELKHIRVSNSENIYAPENTTSTIKVEEKKYKLTFMVDNEIISDTSLIAGAEIIIPILPEKTGYSGSWGDVPSVMPTQDLTVTATYTPMQYTVTFKVDGEVYETFTLDYGAAITAPATPTKEGYTFSGWQNVASTVPAQNVTYEANFTINKYTLKFVADGTVVSEKSVDYGSSITAPNAPAKTGYTFVSWGNVAATMPANDVTYTAQYRINQYTITFKFDGEVYKTFTLDYGATITKPQAPTKEGYTFSGWQNVASTVPAQNVTYEASFTINKYTLKFVADGTVVSEKSVEYGSAITAPNAPAKTGYSFLSWGNVPATMPANDVTYTAQYSINQYTITFKFDGEVYKTFTLDYGATITKPQAPTKEGYTFSGWQNVASTVPAQNVTYEASFTINKYTLKFVADGTVVSEKSVEYGSAITAPNAPAKTGYTFVSWGNVAATMPAKDVTYTAEYKVNQYKLTYMIDGVVYKTFTLDYDSVITPEGDAEDDDYYYGWEEIPDRMPDHDVTVNAYITGIAAAGMSLSNHKYEIYTIDGKKLNNLQKGVNIFRLPNGKTQKVIIR